MELFNRSFPTKNYGARGLSSVRRDIFGSRPKTLSIFEHLEHFDHL